MIVFIILSAATAAKFFIFHLIPGVDIPNHLAVATIFDHTGQAGHQFNTYFLVDSFLKPSTFHPWFCSLPVFPTIEFGNRVFLSIYALLMPLSILLVLRRVQGNPWFSLLSFPIIHNFNLCWGFVGYTLALPTVLLVYLASLKHFDSMSFRSGSVMSLLLVFLYFVHVQALLFSLLLFGTCSIFRHWSSLKKLSADLLIVLPAVCLTLWWWIAQAGQATMPASTYLWKYYTGIFLKLFPNRFLELVTLDGYFLYYGLKGLLIASLFAALIIGAAGWSLFRRGRKTIQIFRSREGRQVTLFTVVAVLCFFLLPHSLPGQDYIYQRLSVMVLVSLVIVGGYAASRRVHLSVKILVVAAAIGSVALWHDYYADFNQENASFQPDAFPQEAPQAPASALVFDWAFRGQPLYMQFPNYHIVWNQGIITTAIVEYRFGIVKRRVGRDVLPEYNQLVGPIPLSYHPKNTNTEFVVLRGPLPRNTQSELNSLTCIRTRGDWRLLKRLN